MPRIPNHLVDERTERRPHCADLLCQLRVYLWVDAELGHLCTDEIGRLDTVLLDFRAEVLLEHPSVPKDVDEARDDLPVVIPALPLNTQVRTSRQTSELLQ